MRYKIFIITVFISINCMADNIKLLIMLENQTSITVETDRDKALFKNNIKKSERNTELDKRLVLSKNIINFALDDIIYTNERGKFTYSLKGKKKILYPRLTIVHILNEIESKYLTREKFFKETIELNGQVTSLSAGSLKKATEQFFYREKESEQIISHIYEVLKRKKRIISYLGISEFAVGEPNFSVRVFDKEGPPFCELNFWEIDKEEQWFSFKYKDHYMEFISSNPAFMSYMKKWADKQKDIIGPLFK